IVQTLNHFPSEKAILAERALLRRLEGGCQIPIGALGTVEGDKLTLKGVVASLDGKEVLRSEITGSADDAAALGETLAGQLVEMGADRILKSVRQEFK
ncbi:MAG TPA: hydroxymethylbilane synthase, partial [Desulfobacteria bacterium]|nr:hydroxymethylbilane synthase [Desulfobacteria bacterium]